ncbi:MAG: TRM11 family methyltransferase [Candidatus Aenigmatarchaeota archaeon]
MIKYIFDFGRNFNLSTAELISYLQMKEHDFKIHKCSHEGALISILNFNPLEASWKLGGIKRIGKVICNDHRKLKDFDLYKRPGEKLFYGVEEIGNGSTKEKIKKTLKNRFKKENLKAMYKEMNLGEIVKKNSLEIMTFGGEYIGRTICISNPLNFQIRDMERPNKNREITTSIRMADIMLNLAQIKENETVLDPFCGNGTILQEAILFGSEARGLDISERRTKKTIENLGWFKEKYKIDKKYEIKCGDSKNISKYFPENSIDKIVSEPELGPMLKELPEEWQAKDIINDLQDLYSSFFREASKILKKDGTIVIVLPQLRTMNDKKFKINLKKITGSSDFKISREFKNFGINLPLEYSERWHRLERLIYIFKRK